MNTHTTATVLVYGAAGHTGRFVVDELLARAIAPIVAGRSADRLVDLPTSLERRVFGVDDAGTIAAALSDVDVVVNCAGPFLDTALPLATAAVTAGAHYLDVTAEQPVVQALYDALDTPAREARIAVVPAMAFYGGLADLLATSVLGDERHSDDAGDGAEVTVAIGLDHWWPTAGTRITGERNTAVRQVIRDGVLVPLGDPAPTTTWAYPGELGEQPVVELPFSETITLRRHLPLQRLTSYLNTAPLAELRDAATPAPRATDASGRSEQRFVVDVVVRTPAGERRVTASGRDIYAVTAPIMGEAVARLLGGRISGSGALAPGEAFDADDVLAALAAHPAGIRIDHTAPIG
jgi:short subunit dehydrogenase-like uncharacterized protein